jgi:endonuclease III
MRASKVSKDTAKLFNRASGSTSPPRRLTRSSLAKFAYSTASTVKSSIKSEDGSQMNDIEDEFQTPQRKRRRVSATTTATTTTTTTTTSPSKATVKTELVEETMSSIPSPAKPKTERRARKPARKVTDQATGEKTVAPPSDWEEMYELVRKMRAPGGVAYGAAVDTMGCERLADRDASERDQRFHTLIALMLSSQTKDTVNAVVMQKLKTELPAHKPGAAKGLNLENILAVEPKLLNEMIWAVGFHNNKTK